MQKRGSIPLNKKYGGGIKDDVIKTIDNFFTGQEYPGEHHAISLSGPTKGQVHHFTGPGTHIKERLQRGDRPINDLDAVSMDHDISYMNSLDEYKQNHDHKKFMNNIHTADKKFIPNAFRSKDEPILGKIASGMMTAKMIGEKTHVIPSTLFSGASKNKNPAYKLYRMALESRSRSRSRSRSPSLHSTNSSIRSYNKSKSKYSPRRKSSPRRKLSPRRKTSGGKMYIRKSSPLRKTSKKHILNVFKKADKLIRTDIVSTNVRGRKRSNSPMVEVSDVSSEDSHKIGGLGPLASILIPLVMSAAQPLVEKLIRKISGSGRLGAGIKRMRLKDKRNLLLSHLNNFI